MADAAAWPTNTPVVQLLATGVAASSSWYDINQMRLLTLGMSISAGNVQLQWRDSNSEAIGPIVEDTFTSGGTANVDMNGQVRVVASSAATVYGVGTYYRSP